MLKIAIRDDDLNYFTKISEIEKAYDNILGKYPINFATVPFIHQSQELMSSSLKGKNNIEKMKELEIYEKKLDIEDLEKYYKKYYFFHKNKELTNYIKEKLKNNEIEISLHGITHRYYPNGAEFSKSEFVVEEELKMAKIYLEKIFETKIEFFVPPSNSISYKNLKKINRCGMKLVLSGWPISETFIEKLYLNFIKIKKVNFKLFPRIKKYLSDFILNKNKVFLCLTFSKNDTVETFIERYNLQDINFYSKEVIFIIATHYVNHLDEKCQINFQKLLQYFSEKNAKFCKIKDL